MGILDDLIELDDWAKEKYYQLKRASEIVNYTHRLKAKIRDIKDKYTKPQPEPEFNIDQVIKDLGDIKGSTSLFSKDDIHDPYNTLEEEPDTEIANLYESLAIEIGEELKDTQTELFEMQEKLEELLCEYEIIKLRGP